MARVDTVAGVWTMLGDKRVKLLKIKPISKNIDRGSVISDQNCLLIGCDKGAIEIEELQVEGKQTDSARIY